MNRLLLDVEDVERQCRMLPIFQGAACLAGCCLMYRLLKEEQVVA